MSLINSATVLVALTLLLVTAFADDTSPAGPSNPKPGKATTNAPRTLPPGLNDDGTGQGEAHCQWCGFETDTGLPASNVSRCTFNQDNQGTTAAPGKLVFIFTCECRSDFIGNGYACNDRNECDLNEDNCDNNAQCVNKKPGFECSCRTGFRDESAPGLQGVTCKDIDECKETPDICGNGTCTNTEGSYTCTCSDGYEYNSDNTTCVDKNECMADNGDCEQQCVNSVGSFSCACYSGYELDGDKCKPINECERIRNPCGYNAHCVDTDAGYYCACNKGFEWDPKDIFNRHCIDIDECKKKELNCSRYAHTECYNSYGSADCVCEAGWTGEKDNCMDVDECMLGTDHCHHNGSCINLDGTYDCTCNAGYTGTGFMCEDLDECKDPKTNDCSENARCINTVGDFDCSCIYGYAGDGRNCTLVGEDLDEKSFKIAKSRLMIQVHLLDHDRQELEVEHERLLRECAKQAAQRPAFRRRREVIDVTNETYESAKAWVITLRKINADLALANHALRVSCKE